MHFLLPVDSVSLPSLPVSLFPYLYLLSLTCISPVSCLYLPEFLPVSLVSCLYSSVLLSLSFRSHAPLHSHFPCSFNISFSLIFLPIYSVHIGLFYHFFFPLFTLSYFLLSLFILPYRASVQIYFSESHLNFLNLYFSHSTTVAN